MKMSSRAWVVIFKGSIVPLIIGGVIFALFRLVSERYAAGDKEYLNKIFISLLILFITYWVFKIAMVLFHWYAVNIAARTKTELDDKFIPLFKRITVTIIWAVGLIVLLDRIGVNISAFVAALGVGSLAIALAAQDTIANIIAGFLIMVDRPFSVGDRIQIPSGEKVEVLDVGIRRSRFLAEDKAIVIVPNLELSKSKIINFTYGEKLVTDVEK